MVSSQVSARGRAMLSLREQALSAPSEPHLLSSLYKMFAEIFLTSPQGKLCDNPQKIKARG